MLNHWEDWTLRAIITEDLKLALKLSKVKSDTKIGRGVMVAKQFFFTNERVSVLAIKVNLLAKTEKGISQLPIDVTLFILMHHCNRSKHFEVARPLMEASPNRNLMGGIFVHFGLFTTLFSILGHNERNPALNP